MAFTVKKEDSVAIISSLSYGDQACLRKLRELVEKLENAEQLSLHEILTELKKEKIVQVRTFAAPRFMVNLEKGNLTIFDRFTNSFVEEII